MIDGLPPHSREARLFSRHVLGRTADPRTCELYDKATATSPASATPREERILAFALAHPWSIAPLDGALALTNPQALLRQKLLTAAAILETRPVYCDAFLSQERSKAYIFVVFWILLRAAGCACVGLLLLRYIR
jgi:hypothetical protein